MKQNNTTCTQCGSNVNEDNISVKDPDSGWCDECQEVVWLDCSEDQDEN